MYLWEEMTMKKEKPRKGTVLRMDLESRVYSGNAGIDREIPNMEQR